MAFDGFVTNAVRLELNSEILNAKIDKINQPDKNTIVLGLYANGKNYMLELCIHPENCRINLSFHPKQNPLVAPNFCMLLRKHLLGSKIISIETVDLERTVYISFESYNDFGEKTTKKLIIEIMGRYSNIILVDSENKILDVLKHVNSSRNLLPKNTYAPPASSKISLFDINNFEEFYNVLSAYNFSLDRAFTGFSKTFANFLIQKLNVDFSKKGTVNILYKYLNQILNFSLIKCVNLENKDYVLDISESNSHLCVNFFIDDFYFEKENKEQFVHLRDTLLKMILTVLKKYEKRLENINNKLKETESMDIYRLYGELIISNLYKFPNNVSSITVENYYDENKLITIPLDKALSPHKNADRYFKKYTKLKNTIDVVSNQKLETEQELDYIESIVFALENSKTLEDLNDIYLELSASSLFKDFFKKKIKNEKIKTSKNAPETFNIDGFTVLVGKNNKQNDILTLKTAKPYDIWFHTQKLHGSHVILRLEPNQKVDDFILQKCAILAAQNSKGKSSTNVPVDYTYVKYVKKPAGSKPGMVIYTHQKTIFVNPINRGQVLDLSPKKLFLVFSTSMATRTMS